MIELNTLGKIKSCQITKFRQNILTNKNLHFVPRDKNTEVKILD